MLYSQSTHEESESLTLHIAAILQLTPGLPLVTK